MVSAKRALPAMLTQTGPFWQDTLDILTCMLGEATYFCIRGALHNTYLRAPKPPSLIEYTSLNLWGVLFCIELALLELVVHSYADITTYHRDSLCKHALRLPQAWLSNNMPSKMWVFSYLSISKHQRLPSLRVCEWISNSFQYFIMDIYLSMLGSKLTVLINRTLSITVAP